MFPVSKFLVCWVYVLLCWFGEIGGPSLTRDRNHKIRNHNSVHYFWSLDNVSALICRSVVSPVHTIIMFTTSGL